MIYHTGMLYDHFVFVKLTLLRCLGASSMAVVLEQHTELLQVNKISKL